MQASVGPPLRAAARARRLAVHLGAAALLGGALAGQVGARLGDLPALARARNERLRPRMETALAPYLPDLAMDYGVASNRAYLDRRIEEVAALGDSLVPLLLEKLKPADTTPEFLNTAANSARVLARLNPAGFVTPLIELVRGENSVARSHAIPLLGRSGHPEAASFLERTLQSLPRSTLAAAVHALRELQRRSAAGPVAKLLVGAEAGLRSACLAFLTELGSDADKAAVLTALHSETQETLLPAYLRFLQQHATGDGDAATTLLALLEPGRLLPPRQHDVARALAVIAPKGHEPTIARLRAIIASGELQQLGRACATTMLALGDKSGRKELLEVIDKEVRKSPKVPSVLGNRGEALYAFEQWNDALRDFKDAQRYAKSALIQREYSLWVARCYVRLQQKGRAAQVLRDAGVPKAELDAAAADDPAFKHALAEHPELRALDK